MKNPLRRLWRWLAGTFAALVILLAVAIGLFRLLLPQVPAYHEQIERWASQAIGLPLKLGRLDARWTFGGPELTFEVARLFTRDGSEVLIQAAGGGVGVNLGELLRGGKIRPGKVVLNGTQISLERNEEGILHLTGQAPPEQGAKRAMAPVLQLLPRGSLEFNDASVLYVDHGAGRGPWRFSDVELFIDYGRSELQVQGAARLPASLGEAVKFKLNTRDSLLDPLAIRWQASLSAGELNLAGLGMLLPEGLPEIEGGRVDLVGNLGMKGRGLQHVSMHVDMRDFTFSAGQATPEAHVWPRLSGLLEWDRQASGWKVSASNLVIERAGHTWPESRFTLERTISENRAVEIVYLDASYLRLEDLAPVEAWLPEGELRRVLRELSPRGELRELVINRSVREGKTVSYAVRSEFTGLSLEPLGPAPGFRNLSGTLRMDNAGGHLEFASEDLQLDLAGLYAEPVPVDALRGTLGWEEDAGSWTVRSQGLALSTPAFTAGAEFSLALPAGDASPELTLEARVGDLDLAASRPYLPEKKLPPMAYRWLQGALVSGRAPETTVTFEGPLRAYPFPEDEGHFRVRTIIENMRFAFARDWPAIDGARIEMVFENAGLSGRILSGSMSGNDVSGSTAEIADLGEGLLIVQGQSRGSVPDLLTFLRESPIARVLGSKVNDIRGAGGAQTELVVNLPLKQMNQVQINGNATIQADWLGFAGLEQRLTRLDGDINFTRDAVRATDISGELFGRAVGIDIRPGSNAEGVIDATLIEMEGRHSSTNLVNNLPFPVQAVVEGETAWRATARFPRASVSTDEFNIRVETALEGMEVILPEPAFKPAGDARRLVMDIGFPEDGTLAMQTDFGEVLSSNSRFLRVDGEWRHDRSAVALGERVRPVLPPGEGLTVTGTAGRLALDDWIAVDWGEEDQREGEMPLLRSISLQVDRLDAYGQVIPAARLKLDRNAREWLAQIASERVEGSLLIPADLTGSDPIFADMIRLVLMPEPEQATEEPMADPRTLPALRISAQEFVYDDMNFGSMEAQVVRTPDGLLLERFNTRDPGFTVEGSGRWEKRGDEETCALRFELNSSSVRHTLVRLGFEPMIRSDAAVITGDLSWPGPPDRHFRKSLSGKFSVRVGDGQLLEVEPGAGRMFGLLSIAALPRRLSLDFRDVFSTGFGFDSISGDFDVVEGQAYTSNLVLEGPAADIGIAGRAGLAERDYDQTAAVRANFGSALPVAGAIAGGPAVGAALLIFSEILKDPLKDMVEVFYRIEGSWDDPQIRRVDAAVAEAPLPETPPPARDDSG